MLTCITIPLSARVYEVKTGAFTKLNVPDNLNVIYTSDPARNGLATFECEDAMADALMFVNNGKGTLKVEFSPDFIGTNADFPTIYVYSEFLTEVESSSAKTVKIAGLPRCPNFKAVLFGNGTLELEGLDLHRIEAALKTGHGLIKLQGKAEDAVFSIAGAGHIDGSALPSGKVSCHVFGGGQIHCTPLNELKLKGLGSTTVYYKGRPATIKKQGIGKLIHVGD